MYSLLQILANQWNRNWGDVRFYTIPPWITVTRSLSWLLTLHHFEWQDGYFMIRRGVNECGIEEGVVAGLPSSKNLMIGDFESVDADRHVSIWGVIILNADSVTSWNFNILIGLCCLYMKRWKESLVNSWIIINMEWIWNLCVLYGKKGEKREKIYSNIYSWLAWPGLAGGVRLWWKFWIVGILITVQASPHGVSADDK